MIPYFLIRPLTAAIPVKSVRKRLRRFLLDRARDRRVSKGLTVVRKRYAAHEQACVSKLRRGEKLRVAFLVCDDSMFTGESLWLRMKDDPQFDCFIAAAPRVTRGPDFLRERLAETTDALSSKYGSASVFPLCGPDGRDVRPLEADIVFSSIMYEEQSLPSCTVYELSRRSLVVMLPYGYGGLFMVDLKRLVFLPNLAWSWKLVFSNEPTLRLWAETNPVLALNSAACGYAKMDRYVDVAEAEAKRKSPSGAKTIMICAHHSLGWDAEALHISTFLENADLYLELPALFPEIKFIFNPHPLLLVKLRTAEWWGGKRTDEYFGKLRSHKNLEFVIGDYFPAFARSDALMHDCGSFLAEYFYTGKPQCYLYADADELERQCTPFARQMLSAAYRARTREEIVAFIRNVVIAGDDPKKDMRTDLAKRDVCVNHPHAAEAVVNLVKKTLCGLQHPKAAT